MIIRSRPRRPNARNIVRLRIPRARAPGSKKRNASGQEERSTPGPEKIRATTSREDRAPDRSFNLTPDEQRTLNEIGRFRTVTVEDLRRYRYADNAAQMSNDLRSLRAQGLIQQHIVWGRKNAAKLTVLVLTRRGKMLATQQATGSDQRLYSGFVKRAEVSHDAAIYRMYQKEATRIERDGGGVRRVVLDYEFKQKVFAPLATLKQKTGAGPSEAYDRKQAEVARENGLKVVGGKIPLPDLRIEFERANGERAHVDLELATHHYRGSQMRSKAEAGFKLYAPQDSHSRLSAALEDPEIVAEIFSF